MYNFYQWCWLNGDQSFELQVIQGFLNHRLCLENAKLTSVGCGKRKPLAGFGFNCASAWVWLVICPQNNPTARTDKETCCRLARVNFWIPTSLIKYSERTKISTYYILNIRYSLRHLIHTSMERNEIADFSVTFVFLLYCLSSRTTNLHLAWIDICLPLLNHHWQPIIAFTEIRCILERRQTDVSRKMTNIFYPLSNSLSSQNSILLAFLFVSFFKCECWNKKPVYLHFEIQIA